MKKNFLVIGLICLLGLGLSVYAQKQGEKNELKPALLVIDIQKKYLPMMAEEGKDRALYLINAYMNIFRAKGYPVITVYHSDPQHGPKPGDPDFDFPDNIVIKPEDIKIIKNYGNAFKKTELDKILKEKGCNTLFLCGLSAVGCVLATHHGASELDYDVFMIKDTLMSHNAKYTGYIAEIKGAIGYNAIKVMLQYAK